MKHENPENVLVRLLEYGLENRDVNRGQTCILWQVNSIHCDLLYWSSYWFFIFSELYTNHPN